ncbi:hypothetical protein J3E68DRAFT_408280 [Trichoderma sp. SZMC 28012]
MHFLPHSHRIICSQTSKSIIPRHKHALIFLLLLWYYQVRYQKITRYHYMVPSGYLTRPQTTRQPSSTRSFPLNPSKPKKLEKNPKQACSRERKSQVP